MRRIPLLMLPANRFPAEMSFSVSKSRWQNKKEPGHSRAFLMFAVVLFHNAGIDQKTDGADEHRDGKDDDGQPVIPKAHGVAAMVEEITEGIRAMVDSTRKVFSFMGVKPMK